LILVRLLLHPPATTHTYPLSLHDALPISLTPMLCAKILRMSHSHGQLFQMFERGLNALSERYAGLLRRAVDHRAVVLGGTLAVVDRKSTRLNSSHEWISYAVFCLKKKKYT